MNIINNLGCLLDATLGYAYEKLPEQEIQSMIEAIMNNSTETTEGGNGERMLNRDDEYDQQEIVDNMVEMLENAVKEDGNVAEGRAGIIIQYHSKG